MKFIVAFDGSEESSDALNYAIDIALGIDAEVDVVYCIMPEIYSEEGEILIEDMSDAETRAEAVLRDAEKTADARSYPVSTDLLYGDPAEEITEYASTGDYDGVYVGHSGLSDRHGDVVGSVAQELVRKASIPVTVVR